MMDREIRFTPGAVLFALACFATIALLAAGCWLDDWRLGVGAVISAIAAGVFAVQRDNAKTRRVIRAVAREPQVDSVRSVGR